MAPCCPFLPLLTPSFTPTCSIINFLPVWPTPPWVLTCIRTLNVCQILPVFSLLLLLSFLLSVSASLPPSFSPSVCLKQTAVTVIWSSPRCGTSPKGWTSCRLRPSSPGRSFNLSTEASRTYVCLLAAQSAQFWSYCVNIFFLPWAGVSQWNGGWRDIQDHLFSVLSPRRSEILSMSLLLGNVYKLHSPLAVKTGFLCCSYPPFQRCFQN